MELKFTLEEMKTTEEEARRYKDKYEEALISIDKEIKALQEALKTDETKVYSNLVDKYNEKRKYLYEAKDEMNKYIDILDRKIEELEDASSSVISSFN